MRVPLRLFVAIALAVLLPAPARAQAGDQRTLLIVSDIHFDPFDDADVVSKLAVAPAERWPAVLAVKSSRPVSRVKADTNYALLTTTLAGMKQAMPSPDVVVVAGDFLAHDFKDRFDHSGAVGRITFEAFVDKTILFLAQVLGGTFPRAQFFPVVGNNDSWCGDYASSPGSPFLAHMASAWQPLVNKGGGASDFPGEFGAVGHYAARVAGTQVRVLGVNSVFWSRKFKPFKNECGTTGDHPGSDEIAWLDRELGDSAAPTWLITHIPPGVDAFFTAQKGKTVQSYSPVAEAALDPVLQARADRLRLLIAGHTHMASYRVTDGGTPILVAPAVSPIFGNDPSFATATFSAASGQITSVTEHALRPSGSWDVAWRYSDFASGALSRDSVLRERTRLMGDAAARTRFEVGYASDTALQGKMEAAWRVFSCASTTLSVPVFEACLAGK